MGGVGVTGLFGSDEKGEDGGGGGGGGEESDFDGRMCFILDLDVQRIQFCKLYLLSIGLLMYNDYMQLLIF